MSLCVTINEVHINWEPDKNYVPWVCPKIWTSAFDYQMSNNLDPDFSNLFLVIVCLCWDFMAQSTQGVILSMVSLPNHTYWAGLVLLALTSIVHILSPETDIIFFFTWYLQTVINNDLLLLSWPAAINLLY